VPIFAVNGIEIEVERHGSPDNPALLLVRGLGSQLIHWPDALIDGFVAAGFHVVTFDNRDTGLSTKFTSAGVPDIAAVHQKISTGQPLGLPYQLADMAKDAVGVLDALGIARAHVLGISMGGMITQHLTLAHSDRLLSATIVMSSSGAPDLPPASPEVWALLLAEPTSHDRAPVIEHTLKCDYAWFSPGYPFDPAERADLIGRAYDRCYDPAGVSRQYAAVLANRRRAPALETVTTPVLVIHGTDDTLLPIAHGRDIAGRIPGAALIEIDGMGHDLEGAVPAMIVGHLTTFIRHISPD